MSTIQSSINSQGGVNDAHAQAIYAEDMIEIVSYKPSAYLQERMGQSIADTQWREWVSAVYIDTAYIPTTGIFIPRLYDIPSDNEAVIGKYFVPTIRETACVKIVDLIEMAIYIRIRTETE